MTESQIRVEVAHLHKCVEELKKAVAENAAVLEQVHDILASFRVLRAIAGWIAALSLAVGGVITVIKGLKGG